jgi:stress response protein SCP2
MSREFSRGQKSKLADLTPATQLTVSLAVDAPGNPVFDISCFGLDAQGKLSDDRYFVFYNQPRSPEGAIEKVAAGPGEKDAFRIDISRIPRNIERLVFTATLDSGGSMRSVSRGHLRLSTNGSDVLRFPFTGSDFQDEKAIMVGEIYLKDVWRFAAVGQGFAGGLQALLEHFGGEAVDAAPAALPPPPAPPAPSTLNLTKRVALEKKLEKQAPQLLSLAKKAQVTLEKKGLGTHTAKVALVLDISGSMAGLYRAGKVQRLAEKVLALGTRFDDDGAIDVFLFGEHAHDAGEMSVDNFGRFVNDQLTRRGLEGGTYYGKAMKMVREHYFPQNRAGDLRRPTPSDLPVYVMFLTDGQTFDEDVSEKQIRAAAYEPIFWQFMGIGKSSRGVSSARRGRWSSFMATDFAFLEKLDEMDGRYVDNANFFSIEDPEEISDEELFELLMGEYPDWVRQAPAKGLLR